MPSTVPSLRVSRGNRAAVNPAGAYVLYWMIAARRVRHNFALQHAVDLALELDRPLLVLEALRADYRWASDRLHAFILDGMRDNHAALSGTPVRYYPYLEPQPGAGKGLLEALAEKAAAVVTDDFPCFFLPRMVARAASRVRVRLERVDGNGLYPLAATDRVFTTAASFRRHLQKELPEHFAFRPRPNPLARRSLRPGPRLPRAVSKRWPAAALGERAAKTALARLPIDHSVTVSGVRGGARQAARVLDSFLRERLEHYASDRNQPDVDAQSHLSPYLHFGHISVHEVFEKLMRAEDWGPDRLAPKPNGSRRGWWGVGENAEAFLDELITWREIGYNMSSHRADYDQYESLPDWAQGTLADHADDPRPELYGLEELEAAETDDPLWNAAQLQLVREGTIHNYLRMLWGKKILEWTRHPREALAVMIELNNKYALDGRNPNSYSGIFWVLGRYDRAWGPERPVFGKVRYMTSASTARKLRVDDYVRRYRP